MKNKIILLIMSFSMILSAGVLFSFPGDHEGYTCAGWRSNDCKYDPNDPSKANDPTTNPDLHINNDCGDDLLHNHANPIHDQESHFSMFGDSLTELVDAYGIFGFNAYFHALGYPVNSQNFGQVGLTSQGLRKSTGAIPGGSIHHGKA